MTKAASPQKQAEAPPKCPRHASHSHVTCYRVTTTDSGREIKHYKCNDCGTAWKI